jgi:hypothetical protein
MSASDPESSRHYHQQLADTAGTAGTSPDFGFQRELSLNGYLVGGGLLIVGLALLLVGLLLCNSFIQGVAGNIFAAGCVIVLFKWFIWLANRLNKSKHPWADRITRWMRTKG